MFRRFGSEAWGAKPQSQQPQQRGVGKKGGSAVVTMDDLFGSLSPTTASVRKSQQFVFEAEDVDLFNRPMNSPPSAPPAAPSLLRPFQRSRTAKTNKQAGGPSPASFDALFKPPVDEFSGDNFELSSLASTTSTAVSKNSRAHAAQQQSESSFEAIFDETAPDFEFANPFLLETSGQVKDAAVRVLYENSSSSAEEKARMLFLLEQLNRPAPPVLPPKLNANEIQVRSTNNAASATEGRRAPPPQPLRKKRMVHHTYNPNETALGVTTGKRGFIPLLDVVREFKTPGWRLRVEVLRDFAHQLKQLHAQDRAHNALHLDRNTLVVVDSFTGCLADETDAVRFGADERAQKRDVLMLGRVMLLTCCAMSPVPQQLPVFTRVVDREIANEVDLDQELCDAADGEVRHALAKALTPGSLLELCAQACSADQMLRPNSEDMWDWLDSIVGDMHLASSGIILPEDSHEDMSRELERAMAGKTMDAPKLVQLFAASDLDDASSVASDLSFLSIETNDSYQPPQNARPTSKLAGFLSQPADADANAASRPRSLSNFLNNSSAPPAQAAAPVSSIQSDGKEAWQQERTRRRSLDRGYMWAKSKLEEEEEAKARKAKRKTMSKQLVTQDISQFQEARYRVAPASKNTRKCEELAKLFESQERIPQEEALGILKKAEALLRKERNLLEIKPPVVIVGDIHGQFFDLLNMLRLTGGPGKGKTSYLFLGDYVDRGDFSCEVMLYLFALKCEFPDHVFLLRGNHECRTVSSYFGFKEECEMKYGPVVFNRCVQVFQVMPIAALIDTLAGRFLCLHGGISPNFTTLEQFKEFDRFIEPGMNGFLCDILWSDPVKDGEEGEDKLSLAEFLSIDYLPNPARGCSYRYGFKALVSFLAVNKLVCLIRAHEVQMGGYRYHFQELTGGGGGGAAGSSKRGNVQMTPPVVTVFSAPNYTGKYGNLGAVLKLHAAPPGVKPGGKKTGAGFRPLELVEPIQYQQVDNIPPPMVLHNAHKSQVLQITSTCPYMPTTFRAFIKAALELAEEDNDEEILQRQRQRASKQLAPVMTTTAAENAALGEIKEYEDELDAMVARAERARMSLGAKLASAIKGGGEKPKSSSAAEATAAPVPHGPSFVKQSDRIKADKFEAAANNDGMNEMNPDLIAEKMERAQKKIAEKQLAGLDGVKVVKASNDAGVPPKPLPLQQLGKSQSARLVVGDKKRPESVRGTLTASSNKNTVSPDTQQLVSTAEEAGAMSFNSKELLALQLLFLLVDREDKGLINEEDLIAWSAEEGGYPVQKFEAEICLKAVDSDEDGKIGFEDYLAFAARSKDKWLVSQYETVRNEVKELSWDSY